MLNHSSLYSTPPPPSPQPDGSVTLWEQIRDNLESKDSFSLMLCPPRDNLQAGTVLDEQKSYMVSAAGAGQGGQGRGKVGRAHGLASISRRSVKLQ